MPRRQPSKKSSRAASTEIGTVLDEVRVQLEEAGVRARDSAPSLHDASDFEVDQPDLGCLCELVAELLDSVASKLVVASVLRTRAPGVAVAIAEQRRRLRRVHALLCLMTHFLRLTPQAKASHLLVVFSLGATCESALTALDPSALGLPTPKLAI